MNHPPVPELGPGSRIPWIHFLVLTLLFGGYFFAIGLVQATPAGPSDEAVLASLRTIPVRLFSFLPVISGIAIGIAGIRECNLRTAARLVLACTVFMVALDVFSSQAAPLSQSRPAVLRSGEVVVVPAAQPETGGSLGAVFSVIASRDPRMSEVRSSYPPDHPRRVMAIRLIDVARLAMPAVLAGLILGVGGWIHRKVRFKTRRDERVAVLVLSWLAVPGTNWAAIRLLSDFSSGALRGDQRLATVPLALVPFLIPAVLGWRSAQRVESERRRGSSQQIGRDDLG